MSIWLSQQTVSPLFLQRVPVSGEARETHGRPKTYNFKDLFIGISRWRGGGHWKQERGKNYVFKFFCIRCFEIRVPSLAAFWQNFPRLTKKIHFILMKVYKEGSETNDWNYLIQAICSTFLKAEKNARGSEEWIKGMSKILEIIEEMFDNARKTLKRKWWSQVSRRDKFAVFFMPNRLSGLR